MLGFNPGIQKKLKARPHDMHAESIALQQRFEPQPVLRSSWLQLARFNEGSYRSHWCGQAGYSLSCSALSRASKKHKAEPHDMYIESNALQQRFVPQPMLRSSWLQLVLETVNRPWAYSGALKPWDNFFFLEWQGCNFYLNFFCPGHGLSVAIIFFLNKIIPINLTLFRWGQET